MDISIPKPEKESLKQDSFSAAPLNDIKLRLVLIPVFGLAIPNLTGLMDKTEPVGIQAFYYLYFLFVAFTIYHGNRFLLFQLSDKFNWFFSPFRKVLTLLFGVSLFTIPITLFFITIYYKCFLNTEIDWVAMKSVSLMNIICVIFVAHIYETVFLIKHTESEMVNREKLERSKVEAELQALKSQIDPHFIFNSLNTLSHLIEQNPPKAKQFNDDLAEVYRYILQNKNKNLVLLQDELAFLHTYFSLLEIRFESAIKLHVDIRQLDLQTTLIPPISLQLLLENAVKHNEFSDEHPLQINVTCLQNRIIFSNHIRRKKLRKPSTGIGLSNLNDRYRLTTGQSIIVTDEHGSFEIQLPLLDAVKG